MIPIQMNQKKETEILPVGDCYKQFYIMLLGCMLSKMEDIHLCYDCQFCNTIREVRVKEILFMLVILNISHFN